MPEFVYAGQVPRSYTELRDSRGDLVGTVEHGDSRDFGGEERPENAPDFWPAPDGYWVPAGTKIAPAWEGVSAGMYRPGDGDQAAAETEPAASEPPAPAEPPAPPAGRVTSATSALSGTSGEE